MLHGGDGNTETNAVEVHHDCGKVVVGNRSDADFMGADKGTNNTAELTAIAKALRYALADPSGQPVLIRYDSKYAAAMATGQCRAKANKELVRCVQRTWVRAREHLKGNLWCSHVYGHTDHKWNDRADELARKGKGGKNKKQQEPPRLARGRAGGSSGQGRGAT